MRYPDQILDSFPSSWKFFFFLDKTQPSLSRNVPTEEGQERLFNTD